MALQKASPTKGTDAHSGAMSRHAPRASITEEAMGLDGSSGVGKAGEAG